MTIQPTNMMMASLPMYTGLPGTNSRTKTTAETMEAK